MGRAHWHWRCMHGAPLAVRCLRRVLPTTGSTCSLFPPAAIALRPRPSTCTESDGTRNGPGASARRTIPGSLPAAVYATLLDEGHYYCSIRTMHRFLETTGRIARTPRPVDSSPYQNRSWLATAPNQALELGHHQAAGAGQWTYFYRYVILDVFQPLRYRLDGRASRECKIWPSG